MTRRLAARVVLLLALTASALGVVRQYGLWDAEGWRTPAAFEGDALFSLSSVVTCAEQGLGCVWGQATPRLGAPTGADWADFPRTEDLLSLAGGLLARVTGPVVALNLLLVLGALASAAAMFHLARAQRAHVALAGAAAVLFALAPFFFHRGPAHLSLAWDALLPLCVLAWRRAAGGSARRRRFVWVVSAIAGAQMVYFVAWHLLGMLAVALWLVSRRRWPALRAVVVGGALTLAVAGALSVDTLRLVLREGRNPGAVVRGPREAVHFALWPEQLFIPGGFHRFEAVRQAVQPYAARVGSRGEFASAYLGVAGAVGLVGLVVAGVARRRRGSGDAVVREALLVGWLLAWTVPVGGLALLGRLGGAALLRSNNRVSVVLLALGLAFLARWASRWRQRRGAWAPWVTGAVLAGLGAWEQVPLADLDVTPDFAARMREEAEAARAVMAPLDERGAQVFVYPPTPFPEGSGQGFPDGSLPLRLHVMSQRARLSFGGIRGRAAGDWPLKMAALEDGAFGRAVREAGFTAIVTHESACGAACRDRLARVFGPGQGGAALSAGGWSGWRWSPPPADQP